MKIRRFLGDEMFMTTGKVYEVIERMKYFYTVIDDNGNIRNLPITDFD